MGNLWCFEWLSEYYVFIFSTLIPSVQPFAGDRPVRHNIFHWDTDGTCLFSPPLQYVNNDLRGQCRTDGQPNGRSWICLFSVDVTLRLQQENVLLKSLDQPLFLEHSVISGPVCVRVCVCARVCAMDSIKLCASAHLHTNTTVEIKVEQEMRSSRVVWDLAWCYFRTVKHVRVKVRSQAQNQSDCSDSVWWIWHRDERSL